MIRHIVLENLYGGIMYIVIYEYRGIMYYWTPMTEQEYAMWKKQHWSDPETHIIVVHNDEIIAEQWNE